MFRVGLAAVFSLLLCSGMEGQAASPSLGIFEGHTDVGQVLHPGSVEYDAAAKSYTVSGSGENMWFATDEFQFVWTKVSSADVTIASNLSIPGEGGEGHRKGVLMIRQSLDTDSAYVDAARHGDGLTSLQFRERKGAITREIESNVSGPVQLRLEKQGDRFYMWVAVENEPLQFAGGSARVEMTPPFYVGIGVCAHRKDAVEKVRFGNVTLDTRVNHPHATYSTVQTVLLSGDARVGFVSADRLTSPGWTADGHSLTFDAGGEHREVPFSPLKTAAPVGPAIVPSMDALATKVVVDARRGEMAIFRMTAAGRQPIRAFADYHAVAASLSPDATHLVYFTAPRSFSMTAAIQEMSVCLMSLAAELDPGKILATFTGGPGSVGAQPWSPDGKRIVFISYQTME